ncbi:Holliday junction resolvase [Flavobacterium phage vB_FspS_tant8-1]|uniref:Uncharacterized protein n=1 Tax=Flavobacterium phage vB_FspS_tant8-1 TaxID=2686278 RepID=A0A6B9LGP4_9CAUD|nr:Holliday junction resolvase [Flavobacterium phage vB_FspS_tant8-1]QHB40940.1 hypothetical protein tant81_gp009 [Flavobacterium phage vB_FspS_tant8-1]
MKNQNTIIAIDPGKSGGIAVFSNGKTQAVQMPNSVDEFGKFIKYILETYENPICFIEKVQAFINDDQSPGKKFGINKMLANYEQTTTTLKLFGIDIVEVYPITWQSSLGLRIKGEKILKTERKNRFKELAQRKFPEIKVNLKTSDALCILIFAQYKIENDISWIKQRVQRNESKNLFG